MKLFSSFFFILYVVQLAAKYNLAYLAGFFVVCTNTLLKTNLTTSYGPAGPILFKQDFVASLIYLQHKHYLGLQY